MDMPATLLTLAAFEPLVGQVFGVSGVEGAPSYSLVGAEPLTNHGVLGAARDPFVLTFHSDTPEPIQGSRTFDLPGIGPTDIFLVPVEQAGDLIVYEAIFN